MARTYKYQKIKNSIAMLSVEALVEKFNALVGNRCWSTARAAHDTALIDNLIKHGVDVSAIFDGTSVSFRKQISLNEDKSKIIIV